MKAVHLLIFSSLFLAGFTPAISLASNSMSSFAAPASGTSDSCSQYEAQVMGEISEIVYDPIDQGVVDCKYKIKLSYYSPHIFCPLHEVEIETTYITHNYGYCHLKEKDQVSGVLVLKDGLLYFE